MYKVMVIHAGLNLFGYSMANIQVYKSLAKHNVESLFMTNNKLGKEVENYLKNEQNIPIVSAPFGYLFSKKATFKNWLNNFSGIIKSSFIFFKAYHAYKPTHIHFGSCSVIIYVLPVLLFTKAKIIYRVGDDPLSSISTRFIFKYIIKHIVNHYVCVSKYIENILHGEGVNESKTTVIYSYPPERFSHIKNDILVKKSTFRIVYLGQLSIQKGVELLVDAAIIICQQYPNVEVLIAGDYSWDQAKIVYQKLLNKINQNGLGETIKFIGHIKNVKSFYETADINIAPSIYPEPLPNTVMEAKSALVPSIIFPVGGVQEVVQHKKSGFICSHINLESLIDSMRFYIDDISQIEIAKHYLLEELNIYSEEIYIKKWLTVLSY